MLKEKQKEIFICPRIWRFVYSRSTTHTALYQKPISKQPHTKNGYSIILCYIAKSAFASPS